MSKDYQSMDGTLVFRDEKGEEGAFGALRALPVSVAKDLGEALAWAGLEAYRYPGDANEWRVTDGEAGIGEDDLRSALGALAPHLADGSYLVVRDLDDEQYRYVVRDGAVRYQRAAVTYEDEEG